ncbi:MAG TPA: phosphoribosyltransferase family protein [Flavisolibacter sp.]
MLLLKQIRESLLHFAYPHVCEGCGTDNLQGDHLLCLHCLSSLPGTNFSPHADNLVEKMFWGRMAVESATSVYYFTKESMMQHLVHQFKYKRNKEIGSYLGELMGWALLESKRFTSVDALIPLPLYKSKERLRGYNQSMLLCEGIAKVLRKPVLPDIVERTEETESQTKKNRIERWENMQGKFKLRDASAIQGLHVLLVDDVITTGATLEACGREILRAKNVRLSVGTLCFSLG